MGKIIDLHIHTNLSDGALTPKDVIDEASKNGVSVIAIADHDTVEAYSDDLYNYANSKNIKLINAVEISTKINKVGIHVLGYNFDINNQELKKKLFLLKNARYDYLYNVSSKLKDLGYSINIDKLEQLEVVTKAHIALDIVNNNENNNILLKDFNHVPSNVEFIEKIMNEGCPAYVEKETISPKEAADLIKKAGGKVILAHPVAYKYENNLTEDDILKLVKEMKADGIESYYIYIDSNNNKINEICEWNEFARKNNLITTIGSDFHNKDGIHPEIGLINEEFSFNDNTIEDIIKRFL